MIITLINNRQSFERRFVVVVSVCIQCMNVTECLRSRREDVGIDVYEMRLVFVHKPRRMQIPRSRRLPVGHHQRRVIRGRITRGVNLAVSPRKGGITIGFSPVRVTVT